MSDIKIYVASLSDYNNGNLHGKWIDANQSADDIRQEISEMLKTAKFEPAEEWAIHDYEGLGPVKLSESEDIDTIAELAQIIEDKGELFAHLYNNENDIERAKQMITEGYHGEFDSLKDYAEQFVEECYSDTLQNLPDFIKFNIDYEGIAHDMQCGGDVFTIEIGHKVHVFDNNF